MDAVLLLITVASGLSAVSSQVRRQYHFVQDKKSMPEAQRYCREKYTDLATIDSMEDMNILMDVAKESIGVWIGLYGAVNSWRWSLSDSSFYKDGEAEFRRWKAGVPDDYNSLEHCALTHNGLWDDSDCKGRHKSVCMDVKGMKVTFILIGTLMTWTEAQRHCRDHHTDLASVRNTAENQQVKDAVPPGELAWIGLFSDSWRWSDGSTSSFRYWYDDQPNDGNQACVVATIERAGKWFDDSCHWELEFVCYSPLTTRQVIEVHLVRKDSSLDPNDPAVMEQTLKEVEQRLEEQGVKGGVKLSWRKQSDGKVFHKEEEEEEEEETKKKKTRPKKD